MEERKRGDGRRKDEGGIKMGDNGKKDNGRGRTCVWGLWRKG